MLEPVNGISVVVIVVVVVVNRKEKNQQQQGRKEGNVLFNDALNTFFEIYGYMKEGRNCFI